MIKYEIDEETKKALFEFLEHGDEEHRRWLKEAIDAFFKGEPRPDVR